MKIVNLKITRAKGLILFLIFSLNSIIAQKMENKLADETSLYLKQHATNPVNWFPWGNEALS